MSYKCQCCRAVVPSGQPRLVHVVRRPNGEVLRELAVCRLCSESLASGTSVRSLLPGTPRPLAPAGVQAEPVRKSNSPTTTQTKESSENA